MILELHRHLRRQQRLVRVRVGHDALLDQPVEQQPARTACAAVEAEHVLVEVVVELLARHAALVRSEQPPLEQAGDAVSVRHGDVRGRRIAVAHVRDDVRVLVLADVVVARQAVCVDNRAALDVGEHVVDQRFGGRVLDAAEPHAASAALVRLHGDDHDGLACWGASACLLGLEAADERLIDLYDHAGTADHVPVRPHHRAAQLVHPRPRGLVATEAKLALEAECRDAVLLPADVPDDVEPRPHRVARLVEDRPGRDRRALATRLATQRAALHPPRLVNHTAMRAHEAVRPPDPLHVGETGVLAIESLDEVLEGARVVRARSRRHVASH